MIFVVASFVFLVVLGIVFDLESFSLFVGAVFGSGFTISSYYIEKRKERV